MKEARKGWAILNMLAFLAVIAVNTLAIMLPINGMDTGKISGFYPNLFVPAGFTFSIWSVIYLLLLAYCVFSLIQAFKQNNHTVARKAIEAISPLFLFTCLLNIAWIMLWHYLQVGLSVVVMIVFLLALIAIYLRLAPFSKQLNGTSLVLVLVPFSIYMGWISVATVANITALLVHVGWNGFGIEAATWSTLMIVVATLLGGVFLYKWKDLAYAGVITWAVFGIYSKQKIASSMVGYAAMICMVLLITGILVALYKSLQTGKAKP